MTLTHILNKLDQINKRKNLLVKLIKAKYRKNNYFDIKFIPLLLILLWLVVTYLFFRIKKKKKKKKEKKIIGDIREE